MFLLYFQEQEISIDMTTSCEIKFRKSLANHF